MTEFYRELAESHYREGRYENAVAAWNDILAINPDDLMAQEGIEIAEKKMNKIRDFFEADVFGDFKFVDKYNLDECFRIAEGASMPLEAAKERIDLAKIKVLEAKREFLPSLTLSWTETKGIKSEGKIEGVEYGIEGKQPAFYSGELILKLAQSKINLMVAEKNYYSVKSDLYLEVAKAYYKFVSARKLLEYTRGLYEEFKPLYAMAKEKYQSALVSEIEHLNTESKFNQLYYKSITVESDFELARLSLAQQLNTEDWEGLSVQADIGLKSIDRDIDTCFSLALENRPDLKMKELTVKSAEYGKDIVQANKGPHVDFTGHYKRSAEVYREDYSAPREESSLDPKRKWYAGLEVNWPIMGNTGTYSVYKREDPPTLSTYYGSSESKGTTWKLGILDNFKQFTEEEEAEVVYAQARKELDETRKDVIREVKEAYSEYKKARIQLESAEVQKKFREKEIKILEAKHNLGESELSDLFDSMIRLMEANETLFQAEEDLNVSVAVLQNAIGLEDYF